MEKEKLSRYFWLSHEIEKQEKRKERLLRAMNSQGIASDVVTGSMSQYPYIETKFIITGVPVGLLQELEDSINRNIEEAVKARKDIEEFINNIDDPQLREILRSRYIDCLQWNQVGKGNYISASHARKTVRDFLMQVS